MLNSLVQDAVPRDYGFCSTCRPGKIGTATLPEVCVVGGEHQCSLCRCGRGSCRQIGKEGHLAPTAGLAAAAAGAAAEAVTEKHG